MLLQRFSSGGIMSRLGSYGGHARSLLGRADRALSRELKSVRTSEVSLSAFTFGLLQGRFKSQGGFTILTLPADLFAGAAFHVLGLFGFARNYSHHLHAFGDGALASFFTTMGYRVGERVAGGAGLLKSMSGMFGDKEPSGGATVADAELAKLVR